MTRVHSSLYTYSRPSIRGYLGSVSAGERWPRFRWCKVAGPLFTVIGGTVFMTVVDTKTVSETGLAEQLLVYC